jgi:hypothetical protein
MIKGFLAILSCSNAEFLKIPSGKTGQAAFSLFFSAIFYLIVFICSTVYLRKHRIVGANDKIHDKMLNYGYNPHEVRTGSHSLT